MTESNVTRRGFLKYAAAAGVTSAAFGLAGCSQGQSKTDSSVSLDEKINASEKIECDVCVVGAGISGLSACVQAAQAGANVIVLEAAGTAGGNGQGVEGSFAANSPLQKEQGIEFSCSKLVENELKATQYRVDGQLWKDLYNNSGSNIEWLMENGVEFSGEVNDYGTGGGIVSMHWYKDGKAGVGYVPPMVKTAEKLGVQFKYSTPAKKPIIENGAVVGVYAKDTNEKWIEVRAKAVILASGGFGADSEMVARIGYNPNNIWYYGSPSNAGDGWRIAMEAGAKDFSYMAADNAHAYIKAFPHEGPVDMPNCMMSMAGFMIWVNQNGMRFCREDCCVENFCLQNPPKWNQKEWFFVFDTTIYDAICGMVGIDLDKGHEILASSVETNEEDTLFEAQSFEELAKKVGIDSAALAEEMKRYNSFCAAGADDDWCKDAKWMMPLGDPPYYIAKPDTLFLMTIGGIATDRNGQAIDDDGNIVPGLYAVGVDGCMLYRNVYTIDAPGSCSGNAINMGRTAAKHACENL